MRRAIPPRQSAGGPQPRDGGRSDVVGDVAQRSAPLDVAEGGGERVAAMRALAAIAASVCAADERRARPRASGGAAGCSGGARKAVGGWPEASMPRQAERSAASSGHFKPSNAAELTLLPKERPLAADMKAWLEDNLTRLPPDQRALVMGVEPQGLTI